MATCALCGGVHFKTVTAYNQHMESHHGRAIPKTIKPVRTTTRTKQQIVSEWEYANRRYFVI